MKGLVGPGAREDEERVFAIEKVLWVILTNTYCAKRKRHKNEEFFWKKLVVKVRKMVGNDLLKEKER
jgi:hypothetical protein